MAKKSGQKRAKEAAPEAFVEDLDLELDGEMELEEEDMVLHNRRRSRRGEGADDHVGSVLPSDAHRLDGYGDDAQMGYHEEEELAVATEKKMRRRTEDDDFDVSGVTLSSVAKEMAKRKKASTEVLDASPVIEAVERDFASLSTSERMAVLKKESPELLKMLENLRQYLAEVKELAKPLHELLFERKVSAEHKNLVSFLETKVQLMLSYCMHVTFYLIMKSEGKKVAGHPVIDNLVELHVYLEKMWPLEEKLQYSLNRLLSGKSLVAARVDDLRPVAETQSGVFSASRPSGNAEARERRQQLRDLHEAEELDREEESAMTRLRTKKASSLNQIDRSSAIAPAKYQEEEDQYFTKIAGNHGEDVEGLSLMDRLRKRQRSNSDALAEKAEQLVGDESEDEDEMSDVDIISDGENLDEEDLDAVWEEEQRREEEEAAKANEPRQKREVQEVDRRKAGTKIESHRGLTKARPKDRKNPRVAQRRKYERGMQVHKSQTRTHQPEPEGGFVGVRAIKPGVVRSRKL